jgi:hypothetical protein
MERNCPYSAASCYSNKTCRALNQKTDERKNYIRVHNSEHTIFLNARATERMKRCYLKPNSGFRSISLTRESWHHTNRKQQETTLRYSSSTQHSINWKQQRGWLEHCATSRKVAGLITDEATEINKKTKFRGLSPRANYTDRATEVCRRSKCRLLRIEVAK